MGNYVVGLDIGGTNIRIGAVDETARAVWFEKVPRPTVLDGTDSMGRLCAFIGDFIERHGIGDQVEAISVGFPATIDKARTTVLQAPNIPGLDGVNVIGPIESAFGVPCFLCKDVWTALYYDMEKLAIPWDGTAIGIYIGTGVGNVIAIDGKLLTGKNGVAGELGHIPVDGSTEPCGCGNVGCLENLAAGKYLAALCEDGAYAGDSVGDVFRLHGSDPLMERFVERVAAAVSTEVNIFDPDVVLLGGGVLAMDYFPLEALLAKIHEHVRKPFPDQGLDLVYTGDDEAKGAVGAALYAWHQMGIRREAQSR